METGPKTTQKINNIKSFSIINLTIYFGYNEIDFIVYDDIDNVLLDFTSFSYSETTNIDNIISNYFHDNKSYSSFNLITITHFNNLHTMVPLALFDKKNINDYLKFNSSLLENDEYLFDIIKKNESVNVYVPLKYNITNLQEFGKIVKQNHYTTTLVNEVSKLEKNNLKPNLYLNINNSNIDIILISDNELKFINTFNYSTKEDIVYYVLFCYDQLNLNPENTPVVISGIIDKSIYSIVYKYIRNVSLYESNIDSKSKYYLNFKNKLTYNSI
jgi:hypothetical protein